MHSVRGLKLLVYEALSYLEDRRELSLVEPESPVEHVQAPLPVREKRDSGKSGIVH